MADLKIVDARLQKLHGYRLGKKSDRPCPARADILPEEIRDILPWVFIMERVEGRIRYRLGGDAFREMYGDRLTGMFMDEIDLDHINAAYIGEYDTCIQTVSPVARQWKFTKLSGRHLDYERLILPLSADGATINMFLGGAVGFGYG